MTPRASEPRKTRKVLATDKLQAQIDALSTSLELSEGQTSRLTAVIGDLEASNRAPASISTSLELSEGQTSRLTAVIGDLEASNRAPASITDGFSHDVDGLRSALALSQSHHIDMSNELSHALSALAKSQTALQKANKRVKRLENDKKADVLTL
ncbi:hypothetical protein B0H11DRAFT_2232717 [Mycena galericulata]|nr:hypothetical protein B0H11DRAFT_2232717 [Mycena galericulata]